MLLNMKVVVLLAFGVLFFGQETASQIFAPPTAPVRRLMRNMEELSDQLDNLPFANRRLFFGSLVEDIKNKIKEVIADILGLSSPSGGSSGSAGSGSSQGSGSSSQTQRNSHRRFYRAPEGRQHEKYQNDDFDL